MAEYIDRATGINRLCVAPMPEADIFEKEYFPDGFPRPKATVEDLERLRDELYKDDLIAMEGLGRLNALIYECAHRNEGGENDNGRVHRARGV